MADKKLDTQLVNAGRSKKYTLGAVNSVIQRASSLVFDSVEAKKHATRNRANGELFYGRRGTLTHFSLQQAMCELEGGAGCVLFPCGAAAVANSILAFIEQGDHVLMTNTAYEPSQDFCSKKAITLTDDPIIVEKNKGNLKVQGTFIKKMPAKVKTEQKEKVQKEEKDKEKHELV